MSSPTSQEGSALSLLSLSIAAASVAPIPVPKQASADEDSVSRSVSSGVNGPASLGTSISNGVAKQHRRLASTGKARRRLSDARDAATRVSSAAALSLATLSLSTSADAPLASPTATLSEASNAVPVPSNDHQDTEDISSTSVPDNISKLANPIIINKNGKKRGMDYKCESCSKIYRHPSCLIKHRWEHTPQWREASKFVLSKHQQVQLLEAAAILSHMTPSATGTSLPEDRSLWPSFLSGGVLPLPQTTENGSVITADSAAVSSSPHASRPTSSSVPALSVLGSSTRAGSTGPRLHDYPIPASAAAGGGITQVRPGLVGVSTTPSAVTIHTAQTQPVPVPGAGNSSAFTSYRTVAGSSDSWGSPYSPIGIGHGNSVSASSYQSQSAVRSGSAAQSYYTRSAERNHESDAASTGAGWSLPRSSLRSISGSSASQPHSRSRSGSASVDDDESVEIDVEDVGYDYHGRPRKGYGFAGRGRYWKNEDDDMSIGFSVKEEDEEDYEQKKKQEPEEWDGMEMEMDMD